MTAQIGETLILDGEVRRMDFCPPLPIDTPHLAPTPEEDLIGGSTACWRGYVATWEIADDAFYLTDIHGPITDAPPPWRKITPGRILATWFSGVLRINQGKRLQYVHMGFGSTYEEELHIKIEQGRVVGRRVIDNRGREPRQRFSNFPGSENRFDGDDW